MSNDLRSKLFMLHDAMSWLIDFHTTTLVLEPMHAIPNQLSVGEMRLRLERF